MGTFVLKFSIRHGPDIDSTMQSLPNLQTHFAVTFGHIPSHSVLQTTFKGGFRIGSIDGSVITDGAIFAAVIAFVSF